jgi:hypothetical protein
MIDVKVRSSNKADGLGGDTQNVGAIGFDLLCRADAAHINGHDIFAFTDQICSGKAAFRDDMHHKKPLLVLAGRVTKWPEKIKNCGVLRGVGEKEYSGEKKKWLLGGWMLF